MRIGVGLWRGGNWKPAEAGTAPVVVFPININPTSGPVGTRFLFALGITTGNPNPIPTYKLTFNGVEVQLDDGGGYTPATEGQLVWAAVWTNGVLPDAIESVTAEVTAASFNWTQVDLLAGTDNVQWVGYSDGGTLRPQPAFGAISNQPSNITNMLALYDDTNSNVYLAVFSGDHVSTMAGLPMDIGGTEFDPFEVELIDGNTWIRYNGVGDLASGANYDVRFG